MEHQKRSSQILQLLNEHQSMHVNELADHFQVTPTCIRRDLTALEAKGYITRSYGYAHLAERSSILNLDKRTIVNIEEKKRIAAAALSLIPESSSILFDSGTTTLSLAELLSTSEYKKLTVLTASLPIAMTLAGRYQTLMCSGIVHGEDMSLFGPDADNYFRSVSADLAFISSSGVRPGVGLTASSPYLVSIKKQMLQAAEKVVVLLDSSKFFINSINLFCEFTPEKIHTMITVETKENKAQIEELRQKGISVILA